MYIKTIILVIICLYICVYRCFFKKEKFKITKKFKHKRNIFLYWVGKEFKLISILRNLIYLHSTNGKGYNVILITNNS